MQPYLQLETSFFHTLNQFAEPLIRAGLGNPLLWPTGAIVLKTVGRKSGRPRNIPVLATRFGEMLICGTVRRSSQWVKNLAAQPEVSYWLGGKLHAATAFVFTPGATTPTELPSHAACLALSLQQQSDLLGVSLALLTPRR